MIFPICIASKGRPCAALLKELGASGVKWEVFVEPQDAESYAAHGDHVQVLPANDIGIGYARQHILERNSGWFWMLDDDISGWYRQEGRKAGKSTMLSVLSEASEAILREGEGDPLFAQGGLEYQQFCWSATKDWSKTSYCDVAVAIQGARAKLCQYRSRMDLKEDRDFTMQLLSVGMKVGRLRRLAFAAPKNGSNAGGLQGAYAENGREAEASRRMVAAWGERLCELKTKPGGRPDVKIHWKRI